MERLNNMCREARKSLKPTPLHTEVLYLTTYNSESPVQLESLMGLKVLYMKPNVKKKYLICHLMYLNLIKT